MLKDVVGIVCEKSGVGYDQLNREVRMMKEGQLPSEERRSTELFIFISSEQLGAIQVLATSQRLHLWILIVVF
jgi:hypothetical protein